LREAFFGLVQPIRAGSAGKRTAPGSPRTFNTIGVETPVHPVSFPASEAAGYGGANFPKVLKLSGSCGRYQSYGISKLLKFDFFQS